MAGDDGWAGAGGTNGNRYGETPQLQEARAPERREGRLRIVYNRDAEQGRRTMTAQPPSQDRHRAQGMLDRGLQAKIGKMLRDIFSDVAEEPVPKRFEELLEALAAKEKGR
jgi:hypothetical protein